MTLAVLANEWIPTCSDPGLPPLVRETCFLCKLSVLFHLLLCVPEPLVNLVFLEVELLGEIVDLLSRGCFSLQAFVKLPECVFLALRLARSIGFSLLGGRLLLWGFISWCRLLDHLAILRSLCVGARKCGFSLLIASNFLPLSGLCLSLIITLTSRLGNVRRLWSHRFRRNRLSSWSLGFRFYKCVLTLKGWSSISCWLLSPSIVWRIAADERKVLLNFIVGSRCRSANLAENVIPSNLAWLTWLCKRS